jgi:hypothetical protein
LRSVDSDDSSESPMSKVALAAAAADDSSDDDDSSNIISLDDSDEEVVPVHKSDWIMTTERGTTTVETVEAGYREYQARVE